MSAPRGISFRVDAKPVSVNRRYVKGHRLSAEYRGFVDAVRFAARQAMRGLRPLEGPVSVDLALDLTNPRQDIDGPSKPILDGLNGFVFGDDNQVIQLTLAKNVIPKTDKPGVTISVREIA